MDSLIGFFADNTCLLFFANGLAFFTLGLAIALEARRAPAFQMSRSLGLLSAYGFVAGTGNWLQMFLIVQARGSPPGALPPGQPLKLFLFVLSALLLLQFSVRTIVTLSPRLRWLRAGFWVLAAVYTAALVAVLARTGAEAGWLASAEVWARYLLHFPALALAGVAFLYQRREWLGTELQPVARDCTGAALAFFAKMFFSGLAAVPILGLTGPALSAWTLALQVARTLTTVAIAFFVVRLLRAFEIQRQRQLEEAVAERFAVQQRALRDQEDACEEIKAWNASMADIVHSISLAISQPQKLEETMQAVLHETIKLSGLDGGAVFLMDKGATAVELTALEGLPAWMAEHLAKVRVGDGIAGWVAQTGELLIIEDVAEDPRPFVPRSSEFLTFVAGIPLTAAGQVLGVLNLSSKKHHRLSPQQVALLTAAGHQLGVAIKMARLSQRIRYLATTEERSRLSREIHDSLSQLLGYLNLKAASAAQSLAEGDAEAAHETLLEVKRIAKEAYADARATIFSLRAPSQDVGFLPALQEYLEEYWAYYGIHPEIAIDDPDLAQFSADVGIQVSCIIQEALTNVRKHAGATQVWLTFVADGAGVRVTISDDGKGFDPAKMEAEKGFHFGLSIMRERAESVGGRLSLDSSTGQGARVILWVPRE